MCPSYSSVRVFQADKLDSPEPSTTQLNKGHANTSLPTTITENCTCGISAGFRTVCPVNGTSYCGNWSCASNGACWSHVLDNGRGMCIRDRGCKRPTLYSGSGLYLFHNNWRSFQDGCRDEHGWQSARILRAETLQTRNFRRYQLACVPGPCGFQGICLCATTRMSTTLQMNNNCGTSTVFTQSRPRAPVVAQTTGMQTTLSKIWNCAISKGFCTERTMDTCRYTTAGMSTTYPRSATVQYPRASARWTLVVTQQRAC